MLFDSHCHLDDPRIRPLIPQIVDEAKACGIAAFLVPGVAPAGWEGILSLSQSCPCAIPAFGVHPAHAGLLTPAVLSELRRLSQFAVAIGEIGLDYAITTPSREVQQNVFRAQLQLAAEAGLPVLIHCRKAFSDLLTILKQHPVTGVMHAFSGSTEMARECLRLGLHISLAGPVTYENAVRPLAVAKTVPLDRLLLETDAPDLAPEPHRGELNRPSYLLTIAERVAEVRGISVSELATATADNARRLFRLGSDFGFSHGVSDGAARAIGCPARGN
jgi:TatD DNase family protein